MQPLVPAVVASALILTPFGARAADLVVWWEEGQYAKEDGAVREIIAAFEQKTGKQVELILGPQEELVADLVAALAAGQRTRDFVFTIADTQPYEQWAYEGRLVDLTDAVGHFSDLFDPDALERVTLLNGTIGRRGLYLLPMGLGSHHVHVWKSLLERAGFTLADIPDRWDAFWSFWCDQVQPAVRRALGRDDVFGIGLPMSATSVDTQNAIRQFFDAYEANYVTRDGRLVIDDPQVRRRLIKAVDSYVQIYRKGCTPPDSVSWDGYSNNGEFLAQTIVMTPNMTLSIPNALKATRPDDYYHNAATIAWPRGAYDQPLVIETFSNRAAVFKAGGHVATAKELVRFLVGEGWLAHYLDFAGQRMLPPMPALLNSPFWLDPSDPHRIRSAMQLLTQPRSYSYAAGLGRLAVQRGAADDRKGRRPLAGGGPPRRRRRHQPRAGGRRDDRPDQAVAGGVAGGAGPVSARVDPRSRRRRLYRSGSLSNLHRRAMIVPI
jgi:multiple sugar transport system substrate-binding protein